MKPRVFRRALLAALALAAGGAQAVLDVQGLDRAADPCADFYRYANQAWLDKAVIPDDRPRWGAFDQVDESNQRVLLAALEDARKHLPDAATPQGKVARFYASGMDRAAVDAAGLEPLADSLARADRVADAQDLATALAFLHRRGIDAAFAFSVRPDARDSTRYLAQLGQGGLGLPDRDDYFREDARSAQIRDAYRKHVARMFQLASAAASAEADRANIW